MAVKYHCPKCNKKYMEWGAEKLAFKCPECSDEKLVLVGLAPGGPKKKKPAAKKKRAKKKKASPASTPISTYEDEDKGGEIPDEFGEAAAKTDDADDDPSPVSTGESSKEKPKKGRGSSKAKD